MHANYLFLLDGLDPTWSEEEIKDTAEAMFTSYAADHCDENNWSQNEALVLRDGRLIQMCMEGDWRGRDEFASLVEKDHPQNERWTWANKFALQCVLSEMEIFGGPNFALAEPTPEQAEEQKRIKQLQFGDLLALIHKLAPKVLSEAYAAIIGKVPPRDGFDLVEYRRSKLARIYELLRGADTPPFSRGPTPYEYRAFDLTEKNEPDAADAGILIVDIHT